MSTPRRSSILSVTTCVPIARIRADRDRVAAECFGPKENAELASRHARSVAGRLALKEAYCVLAREAFGVEVAPREVTSRRGNDGAPEIETAPGLPDGASVHLSISHTDQNAYGLVTLSLEAS